MASQYRSPDGIILSQPSFRLDTIPRVAKNFSDQALPLRIVFIALGLPLAYFAVKNGRPIRNLLAATAGFALVFRGLTGRDLLHQIEELRSPPVLLSKTLEINASVADIYSFLSDFRNYPRFMSNVLDVISDDQGVLHWTLSGPLGIPIRWKSSLGATFADRKISWKSTADSLIANEASFDLLQTPGGRAKIIVELRYSLPGGWIGAALWLLTGVDPRVSFDADLRRLKNIIENKSKERIRSTAA